MKNISLSVLDAYAKRLTDNQVNKLYESKTHKKFQKNLNENNSPLKLYLNAYTIADEIEMSKTQLITKMNEKYSNLMNAISYKLNEDNIIFSVKDHKTYSNLIESLINIGIDGKVLIENFDKNY